MHRRKGICDMTKIVELYKCDECDKVITDPQQGRVVHVNIYVADPSTRGGLIGNNFPEDTEFLTAPLERSLAFTAKDVRESAYCIPCFMKIVLPDTKVASIRSGNHLQT